MVAPDVFLLHFCCLLYISTIFHIEAGARPSYDACNGDDRERVAV